MADEEDVRDLSRERPSKQRHERADFLSDQREERAEELERERGKRAQDLAVATALRNKEVDYRLAEHDQRFALISGSIDRGNQRMEELAKGVDALGDAIRDLRTEQRTRQQIEDALHKEISDANKQVRRARETQISGKMLLIATGSIILTIIGLIITVLTATHAFS